METSLTIADLVADSGLDTRLIAGGGGVDRSVLWAHSCEMADPGRWLGPHELLMTIGLCIPAGSAPSLLGWTRRAWLASLWATMRSHRD